MVNIKGIEFKQIIITNSFNRRSIQYQNKIIETLKKLNIHEDDIEIPIEKIAISKAQASISWYYSNDHLFFSYNQSSKFVDNLAMLSQVISYYTDQLISKKITKREFIEIFSEDHDIIKKRKHARQILEIDDHITDFNIIHKKYKSLAKQHHPDMPGGNNEIFKQINIAHKILKKELT
jgi:hypothetical protein